MKNIESWRPSKFEPWAGGWRGSRSPRELGIGSRVFADSLADLYLSAIRKYARGDLADIGCGTVPLFGFYQDKVDTVTCIDWVNSLHNISHIDIEADLNKPFPLDSELFDTVICSDVVEHIWDSRLIWSELFRVLRPGGSLILGTPFIYWHHEEPFDYFRWTRYGLIRACDESGFRIVEMDACGGLADVVVDLLSKLACYRSGAVAGGLAAAYTAIRNKKLVRRLNSRTELKWTLGHVVVARKSGDAR